MTSTACHDLGISILPDSRSHTFWSLVHSTTTPVDPYVWSLRLLFVDKGGLLRYFDGCSAAWPVLDQAFPETYPSPLTPEG